MPKMMLCPSCEGRGGSSAYLGAFTSDDIAEMDEDFKIDYFAGSFDRTCTECKGANVVPVCTVESCSAPRAFAEGYFGNIETPECWDHSQDARERAEDEAQHRAEIAYGC